MADLLNTSLSGLRAFQRALDTIGHNIANVGTAGYSRQRVDLAARPPQFAGIGYIGSGVQTAGVQRLFDEMIAQQTRDAGSDVGRLSAFNTFAARMDRLLADDNLSPVAGMQHFYGALDDLAANPASIELRTNFIAAAETLAARFETLDAQFQSLGRETEAGIAAAADEINRIAENIASLNNEIANARKNGVSGQPNDLLDERDRLLDRLSGLVGTRSTVQDDGSVNVYIGSGQPLVVGTISNRLGAVPDAHDPTRTEIALLSDTGSAVVTSMLSGGKLGGLLDFREEMLEPARRDLGRLATGFASAMNAEHAKGMDLTGALGGALFAITPRDALASSDNTSNASVDVAFRDAGALRNDSYLLRYDGTSWSLTRNGDRSAIPLSGSGTAADPFVADGLEFVVNGPANAGDSFLIDPLNGAAATLEAAIDDPRLIAAAGAIRTAAAANNIGTGSISAGEVVDPAHANLLDDVNITFTSATTYAINGAGSYTYTAGEPIDINGWRVEINGAPASGDSFNITANTDGSGDNRNLGAMSDARDAGVLDGGSVGIEAGLGRMVSAIGAKTAQSGAALSAQTAIQREANAAREAVSGVNLDEEAGELLRFQQAYQAAAQAIAVADTLFQTLLSATRR